MIVKIILSVALVAVGALTGLAAAEKERTRRDVFGDLIRFNSDFIAEVRLFRKTVCDKLSEAGEASEAFSGAAEKLRAGEEFVCADKRITEEERKLVSDYINRLGAADAERQIEIMNAFGERFSEIYAAHKKSFESTRKLYGKLGFSCGLIVAVILF